MKVFSSYSPTYLVRAGQLRPGPMMTCLRDYDTSALILSSYRWYQHHGLPLLRQALEATHGKPQSCAAKSRFESCYPVG
jgi:hypothetical protein